MIEMMLTGYKGVLIYRGELELYDNLPKIGTEDYNNLIEGDTFYVKDTQLYYFKDSTLSIGWRSFPSNSILTKYNTSAEVDSKIAEAISNLDIPSGFTPEPLDTDEKPTGIGEAGKIYVQPDGIMWVWSTEKNDYIQINGLTDLSGYAKLLDMTSADEETLVAANEYTDKKIEGISSLIIPIGRSFMNPLYQSPNRVNKIGNAKIIYTFKGDLSQSIFVFSKTPEQNAIDEGVWADGTYQSYLDQTLYQVELTDDMIDLGIEVSFCPTKTGMTFDEVYSDQLLPSMLEGFIVGGLEGINDLPNRVTNLETTISELENKIPVVKDQFILIGKSAYGNSTGISYNLSYSWKGDTTNSLHCFYVRTLTGTTEVTGVYMAASDSTRYDFNIPLVDGKFDPGIPYPLSVAFSTDSEMTDIYYIDAVYQTVDKKELDATIGSAIESIDLNGKVDKYYDQVDGTKTLADITVGDDLSGITITLPNPLDLIKPEYNINGIYLCKFPDGASLRASYNLVTNLYMIYYSDGMTSTYWYNGNNLVPSSETFTFPANSIVTEVTDLFNTGLQGTWRDQIILPGLIKPVEGEVTIKYLYDNLKKISDNLAYHIGADADLYQNLYAKIMEDTQDMFDEEAPRYDMANGVIVKSAAATLLAVDLGTTFICPADGKLSIVYKATILGVSPTVTQNGNKVFGDGLGLLGLGTGEPVTVVVNSGDTIVISGSLGLLTSFNCTFYYKL